MLYRTSLLLLWTLIAPPVMAQIAPVTQVTATAQVPPGTDSEKAHILSLLVKGDIDGAISYWGVANAGKQTPAWLLALKASYETGKQAAGKCIEVARSIHEAFTRLGARPQFVELTTTDRKRIDYIIFKMANDRDVNVSKNGYHVVVRFGDRAYDAYTGPAGMPWKEYMDRLGARGGLIEKVVEALPEAGP